jgi:hypothetical protein
VAVQDLSPESVGNRDFDAGFTESKLRLHSWSGRAAWLSIG